VAESHEHDGDHAARHICACQFPVERKLPHLALELAHAGVGLGARANCSGVRSARMSSAGLRAVAQDLLAKLGDALELWLNVREVNTARREQLSARSSSLTEELCLQRARRRATVRRPAP